MNETKETFSVKVITPEELKALDIPRYPRALLVKSQELIHYCKVELMKDCAIGTFHVPRRADQQKVSAKFSYYMDQSQVVFVDSSGAVDHILRHMERSQTTDTGSCARFFFEFLIYLIHDDTDYMRLYEEKMAKTEAQILEDDIDEFPNWIAGSRKELQHLISYYKQLVDLSETLVENYNGMFSQEDCQLFHLFSDRAIRLADNARTLWDYSLQLRELYQTQISTKQNDIMQLLTYVTTIVLPLTLLTGWYGMNFQNMPELQSPYGYFVMIAICIIIILLEIWIFKKKKWFK